MKLVCITITFRVFIYLVIVIVIESSIELSFFGNDSEYLFTNHALSSKISLEGGLFNYDAQSLTGWSICTSTNSPLSTGSLSPCSTVSGCNINGGWQVASACGPSGTTCYTNRCSSAGLTYSFLQRPVTGLSPGATYSLVFSAKVGSLSSLTPFRLYAGYDSYARLILELPATTISYVQFYIYLTPNTTDIMIFFAGNGETSTTTKRFFSIADISLYFISSNQPSSAPSGFPTMLPSSLPSSQPTRYPSGIPTTQPSSQPSNYPSGFPSNRQTSSPSTEPTTLPSFVPSSQPTGSPTSRPSRQPTTRPVSPTSQPSSRKPTNCPSLRPSSRPSKQPSVSPTSQPSGQPLSKPSNRPTGRPSSQPTRCPSLLPTSQPTLLPTTKPTNYPTNQPSSQPTSRPSISPLSRPSSQSTTNPTTLPTLAPSSLPTRRPSSTPTSKPSCQPITRPISTPSSQPSRQPSQWPTSEPSCRPTAVPSLLLSVKPTNLPSAVPTFTPSGQTSLQPVRVPSSIPSCNPTTAPSSTPSRFPTVIPISLTSPQPSSFPSAFPTVTPSQKPSAQPSCTPSDSPTSRPTFIPSNSQTVSPSSNIVTKPTDKPSRSPSGQPSILPSGIPTCWPSAQPSGVPSSFSTARPTHHLSSVTSSPTCQPTSHPSYQPFSRPSASPSATPTLFVSPTPIPSQYPTPSISSVRIPTNPPTSAPFRVSSPIAYPSPAPTGASNPPTELGSISVHPAANRLFRGSLFLMGSSFPVTSSSTSPTDIVLSNPSVPKQENWVIFGSPSFPPSISLNAPMATAFSTKLSDSVVVKDTQSRSVTIVGDVNGDSLTDLMIGYPTESKVSLFLGKGGGFSNLFISFNYVGEGHDFFGWSIAGLGDCNNDGYDDVMVAALNKNMVYVLYGQSNAFYGQLSLTVSSNSSFQSFVGFRIFGQSDSFNLGMALSSAGDFNGDGLIDYAMSAYSNTGQGVIYVVYGSVSSSVDIYLEHLETSKGFQIISPLLSFAGFSIAGVEDVNGDGYSDLAIGSLPYSGGFMTQQTYVVFGGRKSSRNMVVLGEWIKDDWNRDGFIIVGGGFLVSPIGDVNQDGLSDFMVTSSRDWQRSAGNAFLVAYPTDVSRSPTHVPSLVPSDQPSSTPSSSPSLYDYPTNMPSRSSVPTPFLSLESRSVTNVPTVVSGTRTPRRSKPPTTKLPSYEPSLFPTIANSNLPTIRTILTTSPIVQRTKIPSGTRSKRPFRTNSPSVSPTGQLAEPVNTNHTLVYNQLVCPRAGIYSGYPHSNTQFITSGSGVFHLTGSLHQSNIYVIFPNSKNQLVYLHNFQLSRDIIDLSRFSGLKKINNLPFTTDPVILYLSNENNQMILFPNYRTFDKFTSRNFFLYDSKYDIAQENDRTTNTLQFAIILGAAFLLIGVLYGSGATCSNDNDLKDEKYQRIAKRTLSHTYDDDKLPETSAVNPLAANISESAAYSQQTEPPVVRSGVLPLFANEPYYGDGSYDKSELPSSSSFRSSFSHSDSSLSVTVSAISETEEVVVDDDDNDSWNDLFAKGDKDDSDLDDESTWNNLLVSDHSSDHEKP